MSTRLEEVHERALSRFDAVWVVQRDERSECLDDRRFYSISGAQWDDWLVGPPMESATTEPPRLEINKTHKEVMRIFSDYRDNRISVDFRPDDKATNDETANALDGLYRADFEDCGQEATDNAFEEAVGGGIGAWRLRACYEDESDPDNDYQKIVFEPITDADQRVFFDPAAKRQDKGDAKWAILLTSMSKDAFEEEYGEADTNFSNWPNAEFLWVDDDSVYVAEYFEIDDAKTKKVVLTHPVIQDEKVMFDPEPDEIKDFKAQGWKVDRTRIVKRPKVTKYTMSGKEILEEEEIAGPNIPVIIAYGKRWVIDNIERCAGHVRYAKDPQRAYNMQVSQLTEIASISPLEKPIFDPEQIDAGIASHWAQGNIARHPYALAKALRNPDGSIASLGPIGKVTPPQVPPALAAVIQLAGQDIADLTGASDNPEKVPANTSAEAIRLVNNRADAKTFIYLDNFAKAVKRCGEVWLGMAGELYVEEGREMNALDENGARDYVKLGDSALVKDGRQLLVNDFSNGKFRVVVGVGPSSQSKKDATVQSLIGCAGVVNDPQLQNVLAMTALANMDGEGLDDIQKWIRKQLIQMGAAEPTDEEKAEMAQQQQAPQVDPMMLAKIRDLLASADQKKADAILKTAQATAVGGPDAAPTPPDGLEQVHKVVQIGKTAAEAEHLRTQTAHLPQELAIEAANAGTNRLKVERQGAKSD